MCPVDRISSALSVISFRPGSSLLPWALPSGVVLGTFRLLVHTFLSSHLAMLETEKMPRLRDEFETFYSSVLSMTTL